MLKQLLILIFSSALLVFGGIWEIKYIENSSRYILSDVEYSKNAIINENFELAKQSVKNLEETWDNLKGTWNLFVVQDEIDEVDSLITSYKIHTEYGSKQEAREDCDLISKKIEDIVKEHKILTENIF